MPIAAFDTLEFTETLKAAGVSDEQARAEVKAIGSALGQVLDAHLATKPDIHKLQQTTTADIHEVKSELHEVKAELKDDIHGVKAELKDDIHELRAEFHEVKAELKDDIHEVKSELQGVKAEQRLMKWMLGFNLILSFAMLSMLAALLLNQ